MDCKSIGIGKHTTCNNIIDSVRCNGTYNITITPESDVQIMFDTVSLDTEDKVLNNLEIVNSNITDTVFDMNLNSCQSVYGKCPYYNYCHNNNDMTGLVDLKGKEK